MIYLIDDNQNNQRNKLGISFVEEGIFKGYMTYIEKLEKRELADDISHLDFLKNARCILLHSTTEDWDNEKGFLKKSTSNATKIKEKVADFGDNIPLVLFSHREAQTADSIYQPEKNPNFINLINKNDFYKNLWDFVEFYKKTDKIELRILVWGKNFKAKEISGLANELLGIIASFNGMGKLLITDISEKLQVFKTFVELSLPEADYVSILNDLEDNPISITEFRNKINLITESFVKHGKNIYNW